MTQTGGLYTDFSLIGGIVNILCLNSQQCLMVVRFCSVFNVRNGSLTSATEQSHSCVKFCSCTFSSISIDILLQMQA